jgi:hypothetical protein
MDLTHIQSNLFNDLSFYLAPEIKCDLEPLSKLFHY